MINTLNIELNGQKENFETNKENASKENIKLKKKNLELSSQLGISNAKIADIERRDIVVKRQRMFS